MAQLEKVGELNISYAGYVGGIFYYDLVIELYDEMRRIRLPRYDVMMGWIEIFGLPPQFEWVILGDILPFKKSAALSIDSRLYKETVSYTPDPAALKHIITVERTGEREEAVRFVEDYSKAPKEIVSSTTFTHPGGQYKCEVTKSPVALSELKGETEKFVRTCVKNHGLPDQVWFKHFESGGKLPPIYYHRFFPLIPGLDLNDCAGSVIEVGYLAGESGVDGVHGDWYKRLEVNDKVFYIKESGYTSTEVETEDGLMRIKDTYKKELFV